MHIEPGDIFLTKSSTWLGKAIRFFSRSVGESRTQVNHTGIFVSSGEINEVEIIEALQKTRRIKFKDAYFNSPIEVCIYRFNGLGTYDKEVLVSCASKYVGDTYGYLKIIAHFLDWCLGGAYIVRRLFFLNNYPICSWLVAQCYAMIGITFGVRPGAAEPDDIWDYIQANRAMFTEVSPLTYFKD